MPLPKVQRNAGASAIEFFMLARPMSNISTWLLLSSGSIYWRLREDGPTEFPIPFLPGWSLVAPMAYSQATGEFDASARSDFCVRSNGEVFLSRSAIMMRNCGLDDPGRCPPEAPRLLAALRFLSHQQTIPRTVYLGAQRDDLQCDPKGTPPVRNVITRDCFVRCAVTTDHLERLAKLPGDFSVPVHVDVILDALEAHGDGDYRKSILYAAIAVEAFALDYLEKAYTDVLSKDSPTHRVVKIPVSGASVVAKDPVYEALANIDNFGRLLHERPLYLTGRSLLVEEQETYRRARALYATRNNLAHRGATPEDEKYLPISAEGALQGLETAIDVFRWLGDPGPYVPFKCFVEFPDK